MLNNVKGQHTPFPRRAAVALVAVSATRSRERACKRFLRNQAEDLYT